MTRPIASAGRCRSRGQPISCSSSRSQSRWHRRARARSRARARRRGLRAVGRAAAHPRPLAAVHLHRDDPLVDADRARPAAPPDPDRRGRPDAQPRPQPRARADVLLQGVGGRHARDRGCRSARRSCSSSGAGSASARRSAPSPRSSRAEASRWAPAFSARRSATSSERWWRSRSSPASSSRSASITRDEVDALIRGAPNRPCV